METIGAEKSIRQIVVGCVKSFAEGFQARHEGEVDNPNGTINIKNNNIFIAVLGDEIQYYTALVRSFDSSFGKMLENMAISIAGLFYEVHKSFEGPLSQEQTRIIADLLEAYKNSNNPLRPSVEHYKQLKNVGLNGATRTKTQISDYYLIDRANNSHYLIELKIGGDLDNKKARSEKEAIFEQYAVLSNVLGSNADIRCFFATAYNRFGEGKPWKQTRVLQFFSKDELLIGKDFWNFLCRSESGYEIVMDEYKKSAHFITRALDSIKELYLQ